MCNYGHVCILSISMSHALKWVGRVPSNIIVVNDSGHAWHAYYRLLWLWVEITDTVNQNQRTALFCAANQGDVHIAGMLMEHGVQLELKDKVP